MIETYELFPGITLRCFASSRFKQGALSIQIIRAQQREDSHGAAAWMQKLPGSSGHHEPAG